MEVTYATFLWARKVGQADSKLSWKNMAAEYDLEGKILQSVYLNVFATTENQHFS